MMPLIKSSAMCLRLVGEEFSQPGGVMVLAVGALVDLETVTPIISRSARETGEGLWHDCT